MSSEILSVLEVKLLWRDGLIEVMHLQEGESLDLPLLHFPEGQWPTLFDVEGEWFSAHGGDTTPLKADHPQHTQPHPECRLELRLVSPLPPCPRGLAYGSSALLGGLFALTVFLMGVTSLAQALAPQPLRFEKRSHPIKPMDMLAGVISEAELAALSEALEGKGSEPVAGASLAPTDLDPDHALGAFLDKSFDQKTIENEALIHAYLALDYAHFVHRHGPVKLNTEAIGEALKGAGLESQTSNPATQLSLLSRALLSHPETLYNLERNAVTELFASGRMNCQSGSVAMALALLSAEAKDTRAVFIHSEGHVQPGLMKGEVLYAVESTTRGGTVAIAHLDDLTGLRITDAKRELLGMIATTLEHPGWERSDFHDELVIFDRLEVATPSSPPSATTMAGMIGGGGDVSVAPGDKRRELGGDPLANHRSVERRQRNHPPRFHALVARGEPPELGEPVEDSLSDAERIADALMLDELDDEAPIIDELDDEGTTEEDDEAARRSLEEAKAKTAHRLVTFCKKHISDPSALSGTLTFMVSYGPEGGIAFEVIKDATGAPEFTRCVLKFLRIVADDFPTEETIKTEPWVIL